MPGLYFLDPGARDFYADWETVAEDAVALLRQASAAYAEDAELLNHPVAGRLTFSLESLQLPGDDGQFVITYTPADAATAAWVSRRSADRTTLRTGSSPSR
jgi:hypothetical protein